MRKGDGFVLDKVIFSNVFEKDIKRVFFYKKTERLSKAIHLISPAFTESPALRHRLEAVSIALIDASLQASSAARLALSRELLALSSLLSIARMSGVLSPMNTELIVKEVEALLREIAEYEEPRLFLEDAPTLAHLAKQVVKQGRARTKAQETSENTPKGAGRYIKDVTDIKDTPVRERRDSILSVIKQKQPVSIKDISSVIRGISEKTIQRELILLIAEGVVVREGERRWSTYSIAP